MGNRNVKKENDSYLSANRRKRNRYLIKVGIPITVAAIILGIVFIIQAQEHGIGARIVLHIHPHLNITNDGKTVAIPKSIGINSSLYNDHSLDKYGMQEMAPLHTHDASGIIHVESSVKRNYTLGEFLNTWGGLDLNGKTITAVADGKPISDIRNHILKNREQINLQIKNK